MCVWVWRTRGRRKAEKSSSAPSLSLFPLSQRGSLKELEGVCVCVCVCVAHAGAEEGGEEQLVERRLRRLVPRVLLHLPQPHLRCMMYDDNDNLCTYIDCYVIIEYC